MQELPQIYRRQSKRISGTQLQLAENIEDRIRNAWDYIDSMKRGRRPISLRLSLERQVEAVDIIREANRSDSPINYYELMAVLALKYGTKKSELFPYAKSISAMIARGFVSNGGETTDLRNALREDLVDRVKETLQESATPYSSIGIANKLGLEPSKSNLCTVTASLNLLEVIKEAVRLPHNSTVAGGPYMWIHPNFRYSKNTIPDWSIKYTTLLALRDKAKLSAKDLAGDERIRKIAHIRDCLGFYQSVGLKDIFNDLILSGLAEYNVEPIGGRRTTVYSITQQGIDLLQRTEEKSYLDEELRIELLGEKYGGLRPSEQLALGRVKRIANFYATEKTRGAKTELARRTGESVGSIYSLSHGKRDPLRFFKEETLRQKFLPYLDEVERRGLDIYLQSRMSSPR